jgi:hypothetical protein
VNRRVSVAPGTIVKRAGSVPRLPTTSSRKLALPISTAPAWSSTARIASAWVRQQVPTQCPSPPWMLTRFGTPVRRDASSTASPGG